MFLQYIFEDIKTNKMTSWYTMFENSDAAPLLPFLVSQCEALRLKFRRRKSTLFLIIALIIGSLFFLLFGHHHPPLPATTPHHRLHLHFVTSIKPISNDPLTRIHQRNAINSWKKFLKPSSSFSSFSSFSSSSSSSSSSSPLSAPSYRTSIVTSQVYVVGTDAPDSEEYQEAVDVLQVKYISAPRVSPTSASLPYVNDIIYSTSEYIVAQEKNHLLVQSSAQPPNSVDASGKDVHIMILVNADIILNVDNLFHSLVPVVEKFQNQFVITGRRWEAPNIAQEIHPIMTNPDSDDDNSSDNQWFHSLVNHTLSNGHQQNTVNKDYFIFPLHISSPSSSVSSSSSSSHSSRSSRSSRSSPLPTPSHSSDFDDSPLPASSPRAIPDGIVLPPGLSIPDFVLGRTSWDDWMIHELFRRRYNLIDASQTIMAIHQAPIPVSDDPSSQLSTTNYERRLHESWHGPDAKANQRLKGKILNYDSTDECLYELSYTPNPNDDDDTTNVVHISFRPSSWMWSYIFPIHLFFDNIGNSPMERILNISLLAIVVLCSLCMVYKIAPHIAHIILPTRTRKSE